MSPKIIFVFIFAVFCSFGVCAQPPTIPPIIPQAATPITVNDGNVKEIEAALRKNPSNGMQRKRIIDYYDDKTDSESIKARHRHRLLFIQHSPGTFHFGELGFWAADDQTNPEYVELRNEWLKQVAANKKDEDIRSNAVQFMTNVEPDEAEKLLREGIAIDPENTEFPGKLLELFEQRIKELNAGYDANENAVASSDIDRAIKKLIIEAENRAAADEKDEYKKFGNDRLNLLVKVAKAALEVGDVKKAKSAAEAIARDYADEDEHYEREGIFYSNMLLGRVALREGNIIKAKEHLLKAATLPEEGDWKIPAGELDLPAELLGKVENQTLIEYLKLAQKWAQDEAVLKTFRQWERRLSRNLSPLAAEAETN